MMRRLLPFALLLAACGRTDPLTTDELAAWQACAVDADCSLQTNGCVCEVAAITASRSAEFREQFSCDEVVSCAPVNARAACDAGRCVVRPGS